MLKEKNNAKRFCSNASQIGKIIVLLLFVFNFNKMNAQEDGDNYEVLYPAVELSGTQVREIYSSIVGQEYKLHINLPPDYSDTTKSFPVIYLLDSQWDFPLVSSIFGEQYYDGFLPEIIIVGITWGGEKPNPDILRARDFTPTDTHLDHATGNAANFLDFIGKELIPFIEENYRVSNDRTLIGSSLGGLFTLYTLFHHNELFKRYVLTSPAILWDNGVTFTYEENYAKINSELPAKLFMALGGYEKGWISDFERLISQIKGRNYKDFEMQTKIIEGIGHSGSKAEGYTRGLQFVFAKSPIDIDPAILEQYTGSYQFSPEVELKLVVQDGHLIVIQPNGNRIILQAETKNDFYVDGEFSFVHFKKDDAGNVTGFQLQRYRKEEFIKRINN